MQFKAGDYIVHPTYGVGHIVEIEKKEFLEEGAAIYYKIAVPKRTLWIPVEAEIISELRLSTPEEDLDQYRALLISRPLPLNKNHKVRYQELMNRLKQGTFQVLCEVVRDLTAWSRHKQLGSRETDILKKTRARLDQEWSTAAGISTIQAAQEIEKLLQELDPPTDE